MKEFILKTAKNMCLALAFFTMGTTTLTSCDGETFGEVVDAIVTGTTFAAAVNSIKDNCTLNSTTGIYEKTFSSREEAVSKLSDYTYKQIAEVPGSWKFNDDSSNYIVATDDSDNGYIVIRVKVTSSSDSSYNTDFTAHFIYK